MGVSERGRRGYFRGRWPKYPTPKGDDSPEACKAGQLQRSGYQGPKTLALPRPAQSGLYELRLKAHAPAPRRQYAQAQYAVLAFGTNLTHPGAEREVALHCVYTIVPLPFSDAIS
ncbi:hypothetical protein J1605_004948 [Eschrichtius robustus]|uniref:Uncharacterized protein n=1 Tax=Eschrichtius robustus TaxID=9764 RepID=A0AB34HEY4_ESCRO|nr:hypothetical protein J1605_004948 [Eschrichtius robustus]